MFVVKKKYTVNNHIFTMCEICSKLIVKTEQLFFYLWLWTCICLLGSHLYFHCLDDYFLWLDHFHCLHDLQKKVEFGVRSEISLRVRNIDYRTQYVIMTLSGGGPSLMTFLNYFSGIVICFTYNYLIVNGKISFINYESSYEIIQRLKPWVHVAIAVNLCSAAAHMYRRTLTN